MRPTARAPAHPAHSVRGRARRSGTWRGTGWPRRPDTTRAARGNRARATPASHRRARDKVSSAPEKTLHLLGKRRRLLEHRAVPRTGNLFVARTWNQAREIAGEGGRRGLIQLAAEH